MKTLKRNLLILSMMVALPVVASAQNVWEADPFHSVLGFTVTHLGIADVPGHFDDYEVTITSARDDFSDAVVELTVRTASVQTRVEPRDEHLRSPDFFDVERYPTMRFKSTSIRRIGTGAYELTGELTLLGVTGTETVTMYHRGTIANPMADGAPVAGIQIEGSIDRSRYGLGDGFPPPMISNNVRIKADGEFGIRATH